MGAGVVSYAKSETVQTWIAIALVVAVIVGWGTYYSFEKRACDDQGGVLVRGVWIGYECVEQER